MAGLNDAQVLDGRGRNAVLNALSDVGFERLRVHLEPFALRLGEPLMRRGEKATHAYFPETGLLSVVASSGAGTTIEVAITGFEGIGAAFPLLTDRAMPYSLVVNLPGDAWRMRADVLLDQLQAGGELLAAVHRQTHALLVQLSQAALCNRFHSPRQRLARWLALVAERGGTDVIPTTHEMIATLVGGARSMVTQASSELRDLGVLDYRRGSVRILDTVGLRQQACECFETVARTLDELAPAPARRATANESAAPVPGF